MKKTDSSALQSLGQVVEEIRKFHKYQDRRTKLEV